MTNREDNTRRLNVLMRKTGRVLFPMFEIAEDVAIDKVNDVFSKVVFTDKKYISLVTFDGTFLLTQYDKTDITRVDEWTVNGEHPYLVDVMSNNWKGITASVLINSNGYEMIESSFEHIEFVAGDKVLCGSNIREEEKGSYSSKRKWKFWVYTFSDGKVVNCSKVIDKVVTLTNVFYAYKEEGNNFWEFYEYGTGKRLFENMDILDVRFSRDSEYEFVYRFKNERLFQLGGFSTAGGKLTNASIYWKGEWDGKRF